MYLRFREKKDPAIWRLDCDFVLDKKAGVSKTLFIPMVLMNLTVYFLTHPHVCCGVRIKTIKDMYKLFLSFSDN